MPRRSDDKGLFVMVKVAIKMLNLSGLAKIYVLLWNYQSQDFQKKFPINVLCLSPNHPHRMRNCKPAKIRQIFDQTKAKFVVAGLKYIK